MCGFFRGSRRLEGIKDRQNSGLDFEARLVLDRVDRFARDARGRYGPHE